jgi:hypothetical protein
MRSTIATPPFWFLTVIILIAAISRLFPHIPNFTPITAMALFGGVYFKDKRAAFLVPLVAMFISDCLLELSTGWGFHNTIIYVYISFLLISAMGMYVKNNVNAQTVFIGSISASVLFFIITNFGVWAAYGFQMGAAGLATTYIKGIPFFAPTLAGDLFYNGILFGFFYLAQRRLPSLIKS